MRLGEAQKTRDQPITKEDSAQGRNPARGRTRVNEAGGTPVSRKSGIPSHEEIRNLQFCRRPPAAQARPRGVRGPTEDAQFSHTHPTAGPRPSNGPVFCCVLNAVRDPARLCLEGSDKTGPPLFHMGSKSMEGRSLVHESLGPACNGRDRADCVMCGHHPICGRGVPLPSVQRRDTATRGHLRG